MAHPESVHDVSSFSIDDLLERRYLELFGEELPPNSTNQLSPINNLKKGPSASKTSLDEHLDKKYRELFGEEHVEEDKIELIPVQRHQINSLKAVNTITPIEYAKAMEMYQREKTAEITHYTSTSRLPFPETLQWIAKLEEDALELHCDPSELEELKPSSPVKLPTPVPEMTDPGLSNRQKKRQAWAQQRNMARKKQKTPHSASQN